MPSRWRPNLIGKLPGEAVRAISRLYDAVDEHDEAIKAVNVKTGSKAGATTTTAAGTAAGGGGGTGTANALVLGAVDLQSTNYTLEDGDFGGIVVFACAGPITCTLNGALKPMFFATVENLGPALLTLTPDAGSVNGIAMLVLPAGASAVVFFDGGNWWAGTGAPTYVRGAGTIQCGGQVSGTFKVDISLPGVIPSMPALATLPAGADPTASTIQGGWLDGGVIAPGTVRVRLVIPPGGTTVYNAVPVGVVVFP